MECEHCKLVVKSKYNLKSHLENNKSCLKLRGLDTISKFVCIDCGASFMSNINLKVHLDICKKHIIRKCQDEYELKINELKSNHEREINELKVNHEREIAFIKSECETKLKETQNKDEKIKDLQSQIDKMFSTIENLAKHAIDKPTTINTNNVKNVYSDTYFLEKLTHDEVKKKCRNYLTEQVFFQGQRGIARMCTDHIIHTKDNKVLLTCVDVSRKKFKYMDELGNIKEDYDARAFTEKVIGPIKQVSQEVYENILSNVRHEREELENKRDIESMERKTALHYKTDMAADCYRQIIFIDRMDDNNDFRTELAVLNK